MRGNCAAVDHRTDHVCIGGALHHHFNQAVVDENSIAPFDILGQALEGDAGDGIVPDHVVSGQRKDLPLLQLNLRSGKVTGTDFRAFGVQQQGDRKIQFLPQLFHRADADPLGVVILMGHVHSGHVHTVEHELFQHLRIVGRRSKGTDDLCFPHGNTPLFWILLFILKIYPLYSITQILETK